MSLLIKLSFLSTKVLIFIYLFFNLKIYSLLNNVGNSWIDLDRRRNLFIEFAKANNFDPKVAENWYNVTSSKIMEFEVIFFI